jgi:hypothetical protein
MGLFVCDNPECGCVENTALGLYWGKDTDDMFPLPHVNGMALCSECMPDKFIDGTPHEEGGKWHGKFPKVKWDGISEVMNREAGKVNDSLQTGARTDDSLGKQDTNTANRKTALEGRQHSAGEDKLQKG